MIKQILEVETVPCIGELAIKNNRLDCIAKKMFGNEVHLLFSKARYGGIPLMKKKFVRKVYYDYMGYTQQQIADYLGIDRSTVNHHINND